MLRTLLSLNLKAYFTNIFFLGSSKKAGAGKKILIGFVFIYAIAAFSFSFGALFNMLIGPFYAQNLGWLYFALFASLSFVVCVITTIFAAQSQIFEAKDNEALLSLPIKPSTILISRILMMLIFEYLFTLIFALPALFIWFYHGFGSSLGTIYFIIGFLLLPILSLAISLFIAWLLSMLTRGMRHKSIFTITLSLAFLIAYFYFYSNIQTYLNDLLTKGEEIAAAFKKAMPPFYQFGMAVSNGSIQNLALCALWCLAPFALCAWLLSVNFIKILTTKVGARLGAPVALNKLQPTSPLWALTKKELSYFWSKPMVVLNTSIGSVFMILGSIYILYQRGTLLGQIYPLLNYMGGGLSFPLLLAVALTFLATTNSLSSSLISLEGKYFWIAKIVPVESKKILQSKILTHLLTAAIPAFIASFMLSLMATNINEWLLIFALPLSFTLFSAVIGLAINLIFPKMEWLNEIIVVKQGMAAMIAIFGGMGIVAGLAIIYIFLVNMPLATFLYILAALFTGLSLLCYNWLMNKGAEKWNSLT